jgi:mannose-6-phosphate isomerase-like protein (cupin superfamily)
MTDPQPPTPTGRRTAPHYTWGDACDGWHLLRTPSLSVIEERMPPSTSESRHYHRTATQFFYVLRGELSIELAGRHHTLSPNQGLEIPPGHPHQVRNPSPADDARFLVISTPPSHGDRVPDPHPD